MSNEFYERLTNFFESLGQAKKMVLATSYDNRVTARMMSLIIFDGVFFCQTDIKFDKYQQMIANPKVALCNDNIQIEGIASILGHPLELQNAFFC